MAFCDTGAFCGALALCGTLVFFVVLWLCVTDGFPLVFLLSVCVAKVAQLSTLSPTPTLHQNEIHDLTTSLLTGVCSNVVMEPELQQAGGEVLYSSSACTNNGSHLERGREPSWTFISSTISFPGPPTEVFYGFSFHCMLRRSDFLHPASY